MTPGVLYFKYKNQVLVFMARIWHSTTGKNDNSQSDGTQVTVLVLAVHLCQSPDHKCPAINFWLPQQVKHPCKAGSSGSRGPGLPLPPRKCSKSWSFPAILREKTYFEQILGPGPPLGSKLCWAPLTKILDLSLAEPLKWLALTTGSMCNIYWVSIFVISLSRMLKWFQVYSFDWIGWKAPYNSRLMSMNNRPRSSKNLTRSSRNRVRRWMSCKRLLQ